jgi:lipid A 4'-phosphatase
MTHVGPSRFVTRENLVRVSFGAAFAALALLFWLRSEIDLRCTALFYDGQEDAFPMKEHGWVKAVYHGVPILTGAAALGLAIALAIALVRRRALGPLTVRIALYLLCVLAVGPGLVVNGILKRQWGRARPRDVTEFGGDKRFTPAFVISDQCDRNCSFVAGHPSPLFCLFAVGFVAARRRWLWHGAALALGGLVGLARIVEGAHFLSDVVFSGIFVFLVAWLLRPAFFRASPSESERQEASTNRFVQPGSRVS